MDPLSMTASIVALITITGSILQYLEQTIARLNPNFELLTIINTVTDLQGTLMMVRGEYNALGDNKTVATQESYPNLPTSLKRIQGYLDELIDFARLKLLKNGKVPRLGLSEQKKKQLADIRDKISDAHRNLQLVLLTMSLHQGRELRSKIDEVVIIQNEQHNQTSATLDKIDARMRLRQESRGNDLEVYQHTRREVRSVLEEAVYDDDNRMGDQLQITTIMPMKACEGTCQCQCHISSEYRTPNWLSSVIGTLFYSSTSTPSIDIRPCNVSVCFRSQPSSSSRLTYYFPRWIMRAALTSTWSSLSGKNSSWVVRMPRVISNSSPCWTYIRYGYVDEVQELLQSRDMSPFDIDVEGDSVLKYAVACGQLEVCSLLAMVGADWHFKDKTGFSPLDSAFDLLLGCMNSDPLQKMKLKALVSSEDPHDLQLGPLHQIITGMSDADLQKQIALEPSRIDDADSSGMTPLMRAAFLGNCTYLEILLAKGARIDLRNIHGRNALHFASLCGSFECVRALLREGVDPNVVDDDRNTPLHFLGHSHNGTEAIAVLLHDRGADLEARDKYGRTPLNISVDRGFYATTEALLKCGADVNASGHGQYPSIWIAINCGHHHHVQLLCQYGASTSWNNHEHGTMNFLDAAAIYGTLPVMEVLGNSNIPPVECDVVKLKHWFNNHRNNWNGVRYSAQEELDAFDRLLEKKAIPIDHAKGLNDIESEYEMGERMREDFDNEEEADCFVDAVENVSSND